jgi:Fic family protein
LIYDIPEVVKERVIIDAWKKNANQSAIPNNLHILKLTAEISERVGTISAFEAIPITPKLRKQNRIQAIHSSLAIENNTLTLEQVADVIEGKRVLGKPGEIREVKNAYDAYERLLDFDSLSVADLLEAHGIIMADLTKEAGRFRSGNVGVYNGDVLIHPGTPARYVPERMEALFGWLKNSDEQQLVKSCVFHYEFEFIHPFTDGNGRLGRMWQTLLLSKWKPIFAYLPVETLVKERQGQYYAALGSADNAGDSTVFIAFMLTALRDALLDLQNLDNDVPVNVPQNVPQNVPVNETEMTVLRLLFANPNLTYDELAAQLDKTRKTAQRAIQSLKEKKLIKRIGSDKSGSWKILIETVEI